MYIETLKLTNENVTLTVYLPDISDEMPNMHTKPGMLVIPGGGYHMCSDREAEPVAFEYIAKGYNAFILRYSLNENAEFPKPLNDAQEALKLIRKNADKWYTDPDKIACIGFSAGGHLAAALSTMSDEKPNACILGYPCTLEKISAILAKPIPGLVDKITPETPPTFIFAASNDTIVPIENSLKYALALSENNVPFELHSFETGGHGFSTSNKVVLRDEQARRDMKYIHYWVDRSIDWLEDLWKK